MSENKEEIIECKPYSYFHQQVISNIHHFYISTYIEEASKYSEMVFKIQTAGPSDVIYIHLNTGGGFLDTGIQIINAMKSTQAHVITSLEGEVSSMGTFLFLAGDEFVVHDNSSMMIHNYTGGVFGKGHEQIAALESATTWSKDFMQRMYIPFLSQEEVDRVIAGEDIYMHPPEIRTRLERMVKMLQQQAKKEEAEANKTTKSRSGTSRKKQTAKKKTSSKKS